MLRPEKAQAGRRAAVVQTLALQGLLAVVILVAAFFSRERPIVFWLTLGLLAFPIGVSVAYVRALMKPPPAKPESARRR